MRKLTVEIFCFLESGWMQALCNSTLCSNPWGFGQFLQLGLDPPRQGHHHGVEASCAPFCQQPPSLILRHLPAEGITTFLHLTPIRLNLLPPSHPLNPKLRYLELRHNVFAVSSDPRGNLFRSLLCWQFLIKNHVSYPLTKRCMEELTPARGWCDSKVTKRKTSSCQISSDDTWRRYLRIDCNQGGKLLSTRVSSLDAYEVGASSLEVGRHGMGTGKDALVATIYIM